ncbi:hypothetical protein [Flavobacterium sp.]|uniref:hypothetical protein n=1 Tax=Flavobacterium sp. TaxID=239 RepID=UPI0025F7CD85|nr:hypothetical protein [Flavobacterium sp.]
MKILTITLLLLSFGFASGQTTLIESERAKINGTWVIENEVANVWTFTNNNYCEWRLNGEIIGQFTFSITSEFSQNGIEHTYLKLININNSNEVYEYAINSIGNYKMTLATIAPKVSYSHFIKQ